MGQKRKHKEEIPADYTDWRIANAPISEILDIGKDVACTDYAIRYYNNKNHPKFYKNDAEVRRAVRRTFSMGAFNHREQISESLFSESLFLEYANNQTEKRKTTLLDMLQRWENDPCLICRRNDWCIYCAHYDKQNKQKEE